MSQTDKKEIERAMSSGLVFRKTSESHTTAGRKVKTKARKKGYITGAHGSDSSKMKAEIRLKRKKRKSQQKFS